MKKNGNDIKKDFWNLSGLTRRLAFPSTLESIFCASQSPKNIFSKRDTFDFCVEFSTKREKMQILYDSEICSYTCPHVWIRTLAHSYEQLSEQSARDFMVLSYPRRSEDFFRNYAIANNEHYSFVMTPYLGFLRTEIMVRMECRTEKYGSDRLDCLAMDFLLETLLNSRIANPLSSDENHWNLLLDIAVYIDNHIADGININDLCEIFSISRRTLFRYWKRHFSSTPAAYIAKKRLDIAEHLLHNTNLKLYEIAEKCGYSSQAYFCSSFQRAKSLSPFKFREKFKMIEN